MGKLVVQNEVAEYDGQQTTLSDAEQSAIVAIVLKSIARATRTKLKTVEAQIPKRAYRRKPKESADVPPV